ncbi:MAG: aminoacyl-tRNA hydrolase [Thermotogaceae bacterium]|nr:aminoacyl-tRNA hydrolase [Thermotogaceae bacterium]
MRLVIGLGNPGPHYALTRHNVGFMFLDRLCNVLECDEWRSNRNYLWNEVKVIGKRVFLVKPMTYMNLSGEIFPEVLYSFNVEKVSDIIVVYDDISIPLGSLRIRKRGSDGGHNGMKSIINALGTRDIPRMRIGIGPKPFTISTADYVLSEFTDDELETIFSVLSRAIEAFEVILKDGIDKAMSLYNTS